MEYRFDDDTYQRLGLAGITWQDAIDVLHSRPQYRRHIGAVLHVAGLDRRGRVVGLALVEEDDDEYLVVSGRLLDDTEAAAVKRLLEGGTP